MKNYKTNHRGRPALTKRTALPEQLPSHRLTIRVSPDAYKALCKAGRPSTIAAQAVTEYLLRLDGG